MYHLKLLSFCGLGEILTSDKFTKETDCCVKLALNVKMDCVCFLFIYFFFEVGFFVLN